MREAPSGVLGVFPHPEGGLRALRELKSAGFRGFSFHSPVPLEEVDEVLEEGVSPVRFFTLTGGILGCAAGFALTIATTLEWPLITGGKPIVSLPPFIIIAFELTILLGALGALLGLLVKARLPRLRLKPIYEGSFSNDRFGLFVPCQKDQVAHISETLKRAGAEEVRVEES
ncbi:MAG: DUF3341 domain-containing protein [Nitrospinota bacterium]